MSIKDMTSKEDLVELIANESCESVDMKTLVQLYYDDTVSYMTDLDMDDLKEIAIDMGIEVEDR